MFIDSTDLSRHYKPDPFRLPHIDEVIDNTASYSLLYFLDCYSGYNHISLKGEDQIKISFITPYGAYYYKTMSFNLKNARATYQRAIQKCLALNYTETSNHMLMMWLSSPRTSASSSWFDENLWQPPQMQMEAQPYQVYFWGNYIMEVVTLLAKLQDGHHHGLPLADIIHKCHATMRIAKWVVELSAFTIEYR